MTGFMKTSYFAEASFDMSGVLGINPISQMQNASLGAGTSSDHLFTSSASMSKFFILDSIFPLIFSIFSFGGCLVVNLISHCSIERLVIGKV